MRSGHAIDDGTTVRDRRLGDAVARPTGDRVHRLPLTVARAKNNLYLQLTLSLEGRFMFPTKILVAVDGYRGTTSAVEAAVGTGSELHVVHVVPSVPELPYLHLVAREGVEDFFEWRRLKGLEVLDDWVRRIAKDLGGTVAASYYRETRKSDRSSR
jgi:hypothetical protein